MEKKFSSVVNYINQLAFLYLIATAIFTDYRLQVVGYWVFFISYILEFFLEKRWQHVQIDKVKFYFLMMTIFFLMAFVSMLTDASGVYSKFLFEKRYPLLGFAVIGLFGLNKSYRLRYALNTFILTAVCAIGYLLFFKIGIVQFITDPLRGDLFMDARIAHVNSHMVFNFYLNSALICIWFILSHSWSDLACPKRYLYAAAMILIYFTLFISEGRSGFLMGTILFCLFIFIEIWKRRKVLGLLLALCSPLILLGLASTHERITVDKLRDEPRVFLWEATFSIIKERPLFGHGINQAQTLYDVERKRLQTPSYGESYKDAFLLDCHNQYLQISMEFGVIGLLLLLFLYITPIVIADKARRQLAFLLMLLCAYQSVFDMFITGQFCLLFCLFTCLILLVEQPKGKKVEELV